jgi:transposase
MLHITFSEQDIADLRYERYHHPHPRVQMKMEALLLKSRGLPHHEIAACVGVSGPTLRAYFRTYLAGGIAALREVHFYQPTSDLEAHRTTLEAHFTAHPPANATQAAAMIEEVTGIKRSPTQIRIFMKKLGLKRLKTYAIPAKYNQEQQETFKKTTLSHD